MSHYDKDMRIVNEDDTRMDSSRTSDRRTTFTLSISSHHYSYSSLPPFRPPVPPFPSSARAASPESPYEPPWSHSAPSSQSRLPSPSSPSLPVHPHHLSAVADPHRAPQRNRRRCQVGAGSGQSPPRR